MKNVLRVIPRLLQRLEFFFHSFFIKVYQNNYIDRIDVVDIPDCCCLFLGGGGGGALGKCAVEIMIKSGKARRNITFPCTFLEFFLAGSKKFFY